MVLLLGGRFLGAPRCCLQGTGGFEALVVAAARLNFRVPVLYLTWANPVFLAFLAFSLNSEIK